MASLRISCNVLLDGWYCQGAKPLNNQSKIKSVVFWQEVWSIRVSFQWLNIKFLKVKFEREESWVWIHSHQNIAWHFNGLYSPSKLSEGLIRSLVLYNEVCYNSGGFRRLIFYGHKIFFIGLVLLSCINLLQTYNMKCIL